MTQGEAIDGTPTAPVPEDDDADSNDGADAGTPAAADDDDLQTPPLEVDELPAH